MGLRIGKLSYLKISIIVLVALLIIPISSSFAQEQSTGTSQNTRSSNQQPTYNPSIRISPDSGPPGTAFTVYGTGFPPGSVVVFEGSYFEFGSPYLAGNSGYIVAEGTVDQDATPGTYEITASVKLLNNNKSPQKEIYTHETFTVTGKKIPPPTPTTATAKGTNPPNPPPPPPPPKPPKTTTGTDTTGTTSTSTGGSSGLPYITIDPTSGYPGTVVKIKGGNFEGEATLSVGGKVTAQSSNTNLNGDSVSTETDGSLSGVVTIPESAPPGPLTIQVDSSGPDAKAIFDVLKEPTFAPVFGKTSISTLPPTSSSGQTGNSITKSTTLPGGSTSSNTAGSGSSSGSGSSNPSPNTPPAIGKSYDQYGKPVETGADFAVYKIVNGGDATPNEFKYTLILSGPSGTAQYPLGPTMGQGNPSQTLPFYLNLPQGNTLSEGNFQIIETNPGDYIPTYSKGCSGSYDNEGYYYTCTITNTLKVTPASTTPVLKGSPLPLPAQPKKTIPSTPVSSSNTGKLTMPTVPSSGKITLPTTPSTSKLTLPTTPSKVKSCPAGTMMINQKCFAKGKVVGALQ